MLFSSTEILMTAVTSSRESPGGLTELWLNSSAFVLHFLTCSPLCNQINPCPQAIIFPLLLVLCYSDGLMDYYLCILDRVTQKLSPKFLCHCSLQGHQLHLKWRTVSFQIRWANRPTGIGNWSLLTASWIRTALNPSWHASTSKMKGFE